MEKYQPAIIEPKWQKKWEKDKLFEAVDFGDQKKYPRGKSYLLIEFPYPSGEGLHVGHPRSYTAMDIIARKRRMEGYNVLFPIGFDAFGLPSENYALQTGIHPAITTEKNIANFTRQLKSLGLSFDWSRAVKTTDPNYYQWTQWIFIQLFKKGLAYKARIPINWCLSCKIGLANEEVVGGRCERCGGEIEKREKEQWMIKITQYAGRLLKDLEQVDYLPKIKQQQINWIGRSEGAVIKFPISNFQFPIDVFTTRPDTLFGATYMVVAPEHPIIKNLKFRIKNYKEVQKYIEKARKKSDLDRTDLTREKTGVKLAGISAINPANQKEIPVFVADYVLISYSLGAIMAVPAHDKRDFEFACKFNLPIREVVRPRNISKSVVLGPSVEKGFKKALSHSSINFTVGLSRNKRGHIRVTLEDKQIEKYIEIVKKFLKDKWWVEIVGSKNTIIFKDKEFEIIDNFFKREAEIFEKCKQWEPLVRKEINLWEMLESNLFYEHFVCYEGEGILVNSGKFNRKESKEGGKEIVNWLEKQKKAKFAVNYRLRDWVFSRQRYWGEPIPMVYCEECGWQAISEKELPLKLPEVEKYQPTDTGESPLAAITNWIKTSCPKCGGEGERETDTMPNWAGSNWYFLRYIDPKNKKALADQKKLAYWMPVDWYNGGMEHTTLHLLYSRFIYKFLYDIGAVPRACGPEPYKKRTSQGLILGEGGEKMSKSRGNVVNPDEVVAQYGADTLRMYEMFLGPFSEAIPWSTRGVIGVRRFLERVYKLESGIRNQESGRENQRLEGSIHKTIKKVSEDIENFKFNTAVSALMILVNEMEKQEVISPEYFSLFLMILSPFAPHLVEELWERLGHKESIFREKWPKYDPKKIKEEEILLVIQVNGKVRTKVKAAADISEEEARKTALAQDNIKRWIGDKKIKKFIFVPGRLLNIVV